MATKHDKKKAVIKDHGKHDKDTGSAAVQIALLTAKIAELTEHLKIHKKDNHSRQGLVKAIGKRRKLITYLKDRSKEEYTELIAKLGLRR